MRYKMLRFTYFIILLRIGLIGDMTSLHIDLAVRLCW